MDGKGVGAHTLLPLLGQDVAHLIIELEQLVEELPSRRCAKSAALARGRAGAKSQRASPHPAGQAAASAMVKSRTAPPSAGCRRHTLPASPSVTVAFKQASFASSSATFALNALTNSSSWALGGAEGGEVGAGGDVGGDGGEQARVVMEPLVEPDTVLHTTVAVPMER